MAERDKIFDNTFGESDGIEQPINFKLSPQYNAPLDPDEQMHYDMLFEKIDELIKKSKFDKLNKVTEKGIAKKLNKVQINEVFFYIIQNIGNDYTRIDLFAVISDYFDVFPNKFYNSLSNKFKDELIKELDGKYDVIKKKGIKKLF